MRYKIEYQDDHGLWHDCRSDDGKVLIYTDEDAARASRLDLAAVSVEGREAAVTAPERSYVVFSLCEVRSPMTRGELQDFYAVTEKSPL